MERAIEKALEKASEKASGRPIESFRKGERKGEIKTLASFVRDNIITLAVAAERAGVSEEGFRAEVGIHDMD